MGLTVMCIEILSTANLPKEENAAPCADQYWCIALGLLHCAQLDLLFCSCDAIQHWCFALGLLCCARISWLVCSCSCDEDAAFA